MVNSWRSPPGNPRDSTAVVYGISKLCGEHYLFYYQRMSGIQVVSLRYANVYGPRQDPEGKAGVVAIFIRRCCVVSKPW